MLRNLSSTTNSDEANTLESPTSGLSGSTTQIEYIVETNSYEEDTQAQKSRDLKEFEAQVRLTKSNIADETDTADQQSNFPCTTSDLDLLNFDP